MNDEALTSVLICVVVEDPLTIAAHQTLLYYTADVVVSHTTG